MGDLEAGCLVRLEVFGDGVRVNLRDGMTRRDFAEMLRAIADAYEAGGGYLVPDGVQG